MGAMARMMGVFSVALALVVGCAAPAPTATPTTPPVTAATPTKAPTATPTKRPLVRVTGVTSSLSLTFLVPFLGRALGYWQEEGLDVDWIDAGGGAKALAAVVGGSTDFSFNDFPPEVIRAIDAGQKVKAIAIAQQRGNTMLVLNKKIAEERGVSEKSSLADKAKALKGLTLTTRSAGGSGYASLKAIFAAANMDPERDADVTFITEPAAQVVAFQQGRIDALWTAPPASVVPIITGEGIALVNLAGGDIPSRANIAQTGLMVQEPTISGKPEVVDAAVRAVWRAERFFHKDIAGAAKALRTLDFFAEFEERAFNKSVDMLKGSVPENPILTKQQFEELTQFYNEIVTAEERTKITMQQLFDEGPAQRAKKQLGF